MGLVNTDIATRLFYHPLCGHDSQSAQVRYLYVKHGDVVKELQAVKALRGKVPEGGPDAYLAEFLYWVGRAPLLLLSAKSGNDSIRIDNVEARVFPSRIEGLGPFARPIALARVFFVSVWKALRHRPQRIVCGTTGPLLWMCCLVARIQGAPWVHSRHNRVDVMTSNPGKRLVAALDRFVIKRAKAVICNGPYLRDQLKGLGLREEVILEFNVGLRDLVAANHASSPLLFHGDSPLKTILYVGRIEAAKGVLDLMDACAETLLEDPTLRLAYAGAGKALPDLERKAVKLGLEKQVIFHGQVPHRGVGALLQQAWLLVVPTRSSFPEGRCKAAMEGLALGVPVIAPDFGPFPYLIKHKKNGLLFQPDSIADLKAKILTVMNNESLRKSLSDGASLSGKLLLDPPVRFGRAVQTAFDM
jgi:glycosyltransferase involved in cell wall biosynthesis